MNTSWIICGFSDLMFFGLQENYICDRGGNTESILHRPIYIMNGKSPWCPLHCFTRPCS